MQPLQPLLLLRARLLTLPATLTLPARSALHYASLHGHAPVVEYLLSKAEARGVARR